MSNLAILGKENYLYHTVFPAMNNDKNSLVPLQRCWHPHCYDASNNGFLVLQDMSAPMSNYRHLPQRQFFDDAHVRCALDSLARMHAFSVAWNLRRASGEGDDRLVESYVRQDCEWFMTGLNVSVEKGESLIVY